MADAALRASVGECERRRSDMAVPDIGVRSGGGVSVLCGPESYAERSSPRDRASSRSIAFSPRGDYFAWAGTSTIEIVKNENKAWVSHKSIPSPKTTELQFSPMGKYLISMEPYTVKNNEPVPNMNLYCVETGNLVNSFIQIVWQSSWSSDEKVFGRLVNNEVLLYENLDFSKPSIVMNCAKIASFSLSPTPLQRCSVACHMPGSINLPSFGKLFKYPNFESTQAVASKGFFQGDSVKFYWNTRGSSVLFMTSTEVDKTGASYYGRQTLHYADVKGDTSLVQLGKEGPIYDVAWSPKGQEFCVVYGVMPAKTTLFNLKCNPIFEFGAAPRNSIYFSPNGSHLLLCGFGNLPGRLDVWDMETKRQLNTCDAPDTTGIIWDPRSECFISYTTAPRLRIDNGYKVWHSTGSLMHEVKWEGELYDLIWQPGDFPASALANKKPKPIAPSKPALGKQPYRPPCAKGAQSSFKVHDEEEKPHMPGQMNSDGPSKAALKKKKNREARKAKKAEEQAAVTTTTGTPPEADGSEDEDTKKPPGGRTYEQRRKAPVTNDPDKDKKIKNIIKKLEAIDKLKSEIATGKNLDTNQMAKIAKENDLLKELGELNL